MWLEVLYFFQSSEISGPAPERSLTGSVAEKDVEQRSPHHFQKNEMAAFDERRRCASLESLMKSTGVSACSTPIVR